MEPTDPPVADIPVVLAAPASFFLFARDDNDEWDATLEGLDRGEYNQTKLRRLSFFLDVGLPSGSPMGFAFDGTLLSARERHHTSADAALDDFNRAIALLSLGGLLLPAVDATSLAFGSLLPTGYFRYRACLGVTARVQRALGEGSPASDLADELFEPRRVLRSEVMEAWTNARPVRTVTEQVNLGSLSASLMAFQRATYRDSMVYGWTLVEQLLNRIWVDWFLPGNTQPDGRKRRLDGLARTVAAKIEFMYMGGLLDEAVYKLLSAARKARNKYIHDDRTPVPSECLDCIVGAVSLVEKLCQLHGSTFTAKALRKSIRAAATGPPPIPRAVTSRASDIDWSKPLLYRVLSPLPGEPLWEGEYETFSDIQVRTGPR